MLNSIIHYFIFREETSVWNEINRNEEIAERQKQNSIDIDLIDEGDLEVSDY